MLLVSDSSEKGISPMPALVAHSLAPLLFEEYGLDKNGLFVVAFSGGCDSRVLLHLLLNLKKKTSIQIVVAHFDHGLNKDSSLWARQCQKWCETLGVSFTTHRENIAALVRGNVEANARVARYKWLASVAGSKGVVLTAHHANDQAETFLLNLFKGKSIQSLSGIAPIRAIQYGNTVRLVRPLLDFSLKQIRDYATYHQLEFIQDSANFNLTFDRNFIRHRVLPELVARNPDILARLNKAAKNCLYIANNERACYRGLLNDMQNPQMKDIFCLASPLSISILSEYEAYTFFGVIRYWLESNGFKSPSDVALIALYEGFNHAKGYAMKTATLMEFKTATMSVFRNHLYLIRKVSSPRIKVIDVKGTQPTSIGNQIALTFNSSSRIGLNRRLLKNHVLQLVWRQGGERVTLPNRRHRCALKKVWQQMAVPPWVRDNLPMLSVDDEIIWLYVVGFTQAAEKWLKKEGLLPQFSCSAD